MSLKRQADILQAVRVKGSYNIADLAVLLKVSTETIRRNVQPLIDTGAVLKFHGGVMIPEQVEEPPFVRRMQVNRDAKRSVALLVRDLVKDGDSLMLDNGTTSAYVADALANHSRLVVVTHSAEIAYRLASRNANRVFMAGGELGGEDAASFGSSTLDFFAQFQVRYAFLSVGGITRSGDLADFHMFEAEVSRVAMKQAHETWIIADRTKFGREAPVKVCELPAVNGIISDGLLPLEFKSRCEAAGVRIVTPESSF